MLTHLLPPALLGACQMLAGRAQAARSCRQLALRGLQCPLLRPGPHGSCCTHHTAGHEATTVLKSLGATRTARSAPGGRGAVLRRPAGGGVFLLQPAVSPCAQTGVRVRRIRRLTQPRVRRDGACEAGNTAFRFEPMPGSCHIHVEGLACRDITSCDRASAAPRYSEDAKTGRPTLWRLHSSVSNSNSG